MMTFDAIDFDIGKCKSRDVLAGDLYKQIILPRYSGRDLYAINVPDISLVSGITYTDATLLNSIVYLLQDSKRFDSTKPDIGAFKCVAEVMDSINVIAGNPTLRGTVDEAELALIVKGIKKYFTKGKIGILFVIQKGSKYSYECIKPDMVGSSDPVQYLCIFKDAATPQKYYPIVNRECVDNTSNLPAASDSDDVDGNAGRRLDVDRKALSEYEEMVNAAIPLIEAINELENLEKVLRASKPKPAKPEDDVFTPLHKLKDEHTSAINNVVKISGSASVVSGIAVYNLKWLSLVTPSIELANFMTAFIGMPLLDMYCIGFNDLILNYMNHDDRVNTEKMTTHAGHPLTKRVELVLKNILLLKSYIANATPNFEQRLKVLNNSVELITKDADLLAAGAISIPAREWLRKSREIEIPIKDLVKKIALISDVFDTYKAAIESANNSKDWMPKTALEKKEQIMNTTVVVKKVTLEREAIAKSSPSGFVELNVGMAASVAPVHSATTMPTASTTSTATTVPAMPTASTVTTAPTMPTATMAPMVMSTGGWWRPVSMATKLLTAMLG